MLRSIYDMCDDYRVCEFFGFSVNNLCVCEVIIDFLKICRKDDLIIGLMWMCLIVILLCIDDINNYYFLL